MGTSVNLDVVSFTFSLNEFNQCLYFIGILPKEHLFARRVFTDEGEETYATVYYAVAQMVVDVDCWIFLDSFV